MTYIFFVFDHGVKGLFMKSTTGCRCYHTGFLSEGYVFDVAPRGVRKIVASEYFSNNKIYELYETPVFIPHVYLEAISQTEVLYGFLDYFGFLLRMFHLRVKDFYGQICSEKVMEDLYNNGYRTDRWSPGDAPLSPCELLEVIRNECKRH